jgi:dephospho-CoA kinase
MGVSRAQFLSRAEAAGADFAIMDIPLLLETGGERNVDVVVVVSAPEAVQRRRVLGRPGMTQEKFDAILAAQMPDQDKRARADFVIDTSLGLNSAKSQVAAVITALRERAKQVN